jgi:TRAP-type C4-dicarboxylate transport system substrate-binding protein
MSRPARQARQFHNQPEDSHLHGFLVRLWHGVRADTDGALDVAVHAQCGGIAGSDPQALSMLVSGELEFHTLMGGILAAVVPEADAQGIPFAWPDAPTIFSAMDGSLGACLADACAGRGILMLPEATFENGFRHIGTSTRPVRDVGDLAGMRVRVPDGEMFRDLFSRLGAVPVTVNIRELHAAVAGRLVDAQENALVVMQVNRLLEPQRYLSLTGHMWSGFNFLGNLAFWQSLPGEWRESIRLRAREAAIAQRAHTARVEAGLLDQFARAGIVVNTADTYGFRTALGDGFYPAWRARIGPRAWQALEDAVGALAWPDRASSGGRGRRDSNRQRIGIGDIHLVADPQLPRSDRI